MSRRRVQSQKTVTKTEQPPSRRRRWLAAGLVLAAVLLILFFKMASNSATANLSVAENTAAATMPALDPPAAAPAAQASVVSPQTDPLPADPEAQVDWILKNGRPALILFHSTNCKPCIAMTALVEQIRPPYQAGVVFVDVVTNDAANAALVRRAGIRTIPTTFFISRSGEGHGFIGLMQEADLRAELDKLAASE